MAIFTISPDFLRDIASEEKTYFTDVLFVFTQRGNSFKVTKDKNGEVLSIYRSIEHNADIIKTWLELMSYTPSRFEKIDVDVSLIDCLETKFIKICKETKNEKKLIVYSKQNIKKFEAVDDTIEFENVKISVYDRDEAQVELNRTVKTGDVIINSQVAKGGSSIEGSKNEN